MPRPRHDGAQPLRPSKIRLNERFLRTVQPLAERAIYWDTIQRGLALAVEPTGHMSYKLVYRFGGRPRWYTISNASLIGLADARKIASSKMADVVKGSDIQAEKRARLKAGTFTELAARYRDEFSKRRNKSWEQAEALVDRYLLPRWGDLAAHNIARNDVRTIVRNLTNAGAPILANQVLAAASAIFSWAIREEAIELVANPCAGVERNPTKARERVLSEMELPVFWRACDQAGPVRGQALRMILMTGQRPGEVVHMRREHIVVGRHKFADASGRAFEATGGWWTLPGQPEETLEWPGTKNAQTHRVWLPDSALELIDGLADCTTGFAFGSERDRAVSGLGTAMQGICKSIKVTAPDKITPHDLRRTFGTIVTALGYTRDQMDRLLNHKDGGVGAVYDRHTYAEEIRRIAEAVATRVGSLVRADMGTSNVVPLRP